MKPNQHKQISGDPAGYVGNQHPDGSVICLKCGLRCNGSLGFWGELSAREAQKARAYGLDVVDTETVRGFRIPCPQFRENRCMIYREDGRPQVCQNYRCRMLQRYLDGRLTQSSALRIIHLAISLNGRISGSMGAKKATAIIRLAKAIGPSCPGGEGETPKLVYEQLERYIADLPDARNMTDRWRDRLLHDIFKAGRLLRLHFIGPEPPGNGKVR